MPNYVFYYKITLWGCIDINAPSEAEATEEFEQLPNADLLEDADTCSCDDVEIVNIETNASPLEQLAEQGE